MNTTGKNIVFEIYNQDGTRFNNLVLHKSVVDSVVMSLGDKITGDVYYPNNNLHVTMQEYIVYEGVHYVLVSPPTIVKEGMVSENSQMNGMTKYSFVFYHPMYQLGNIPFTDVAVTSGEGKYLSENNTFSWIGYPDDLIAKLNKNLQSTQWIVEKSSRFPTEENEKLSEVIPFDNAMISDVLKTFHDTWNVPYIIDSVGSSESSYASGKRFKIVIGLPSNEIYEDAQHEQQEEPYVFQYGQGVGLKNNSRTPRNNKIVTRIAGYGSERNIPYGYPQVPWYGNQSWDYTINNDSTNPNSYPIYKGIYGGKYVKLIKHPFTRKNLMPSVYYQTLFNKISPYLEREVLPVENTYDGFVENLDSAIQKASSENEANGLRALKGTMQSMSSAGVAGTQEFGNIQSSGYAGSVTLAYRQNGDKVYSGIIGIAINNAVLSNRFEDIVEEVSFVVNPNYDPSINLVDYYDAVGEDYPNNINPSAPSYERHEFEDVYPRLGDEEISGVQPDYEDKIDYIQFSEIESVFQRYYPKARNNIELSLLQDGYEDINSGYVYMEKETEFTDSDGNGGKLTVKADDLFLYIKYEAYGVFAFSFSIKSLKEGAVIPPADWDDTMDDNGEYKQSYFRITLPVLSFDLYACASITEQMDINMRSGACIGCTFPIQVDWDDYKKNFYDADGNFMPDGAQRDVVKYPKSNEESITVIVQKDLETFGTLMPNIYQQPQAGDKFVILGISLPIQYIKDAEDELDDAAKGYMLENNIHYFDYPLKFDEHFLSTHAHILGNLKPNSIVRFDYAGEELELYVKQLSVKYGESTLPKYDITLTDNVDIVLNQIGQTVEDVGKLSSVVSMLRQEAETNVWAALSKRLSKADDDTAQGFIRFLKGLQIGDSFNSGMLGSGGVFRIDGDGLSYLEVDKMYVRMKAYFDNVEIKEFQHSSGNRIVSKAGVKCSRVEWVNEDGEYLEQTSENLSSVVKFRCFFRAKDGEDTVTNDFVASATGQQDLAYCNKTTVDGGLNQHSYWRAVIGKNAELTVDGEAWIDLSVSDCRSGSDIPVAGDDIIQLGNRTDTERQGAIIEYVGGEDAPSYKIYQGINGYNFTNKCQIEFGYSSSTGHAYMDVYGDAYIGDRNGTTFVKYEQNNPTTHAPKLTIKAEIDIQSTFGGESFQQRVEEYAPEYDDREIRAMIDGLQDQIDGAIDTWFYDYMPVAKDQTGAPSSTTPLIWLDNARTIPCYPYYDWYIADQVGSIHETNTERLKHLGDIFYDNKTGYAFRFSNTGTERVPLFAWVEITDSAVIKALHDAAQAQETADHKSTIFLNDPTAQTNKYPTDYKKGDSWVLPSGSGEVNISNTATERKFKRGSILTTDVDMNGSYNPLDWSEKVRYTDDTYAHGFDFLTSNLARMNTTQIDGGLILSSLIGLRDSNQNIQSGINGIIDAAKKGNGIAAWYGGEQGDKEDQENYTGVTRWAKSLFRFDGSGYLADGNITWNASGAVTIKNITTLYAGQDTDILNELATFNEAFNFATSGSGGSQTVLSITPRVPFTTLEILDTSVSPNVGRPVATQKWVNDNYISISFFETLFNALNSNGQKINANTTTGIASIKAMFGFWTDQYLSALGRNSSGGGGGGGGGTSLDAVWSAMANATTEQINLTHLTTALTSYATQQWVGLNYVSETDLLTALGYYLPLTGGTVTGNLTVSGNVNIVGLLTVGGDSLSIVVDITEYMEEGDILPVGLGYTYVYGGMPVECYKYTSRNRQGYIYDHIAFVPKRGCEGATTTTYPFPESVIEYSKRNTADDYTYLGTYAWADASVGLKQLFLDGMFLPLTGGTMSTTNLITNLNADLLDGHHYSDFAAQDNGYVVAQNGVVFNINGKTLETRYAGADAGRLLFDGNVIAYKSEITDGIVRKDVAVLPEASANTMDSIYVVPMSSGTTTNNKFDEWITIDTLQVSYGGSWHNTRFGGEALGFYPADIPSTPHAGDILLASSPNPQDNAIIYTYNAGLGGWLPSSVPAYTTYKIGSATYVYIEDYQSLLVAWNNISNYSTQHAYSWEKFGGSGNVTSIVLGSTSYNPVNGVVTLPSYPSTLDDIADGSTRKLSVFMTNNSDELTLAGTKKWTKNAQGQALVTGNIATQIEYIGLTFFAKALGVQGTKYSTLYTNTDGRMLVKYDTVNGSSPTTKTIAYTSDIPIVSYPVTSVVGATGDVSANTIATQLIAAGYSFTDTWKPATTSQEGYVPKLQLASSPNDTIIQQSSGYVLTYNPINETAPVWRKLPANAFNDTTYTLAGLMGSTAIGGATQPIYWNGSAFANTTYTLGKSVPADAVFTDTNTARLQVDARGFITTAESSAAQIGILGGTNKFTISDGRNSFDVTITPSVTFPVTSVVGQTGAVTTTQIASALTDAGYKLTDTVYSLPTASSTVLGGVKVGNTLAISSGVLNLVESGVTAGTYKRVTVDAYGRVTYGDNVDSDTNTWRNIYTGGTSRVGTGNDTKAMNFSGSNGLSVSYYAAGTGQGQSGSADYFTIALGLSAATSSTIGGVAIGYTTNEKNYAVQLDGSNRMYVNVPWENTTYDLSDYLKKSVGGTVAGALKVKGSNYSGYVQLNADLGGTVSFYGATQGVSAITIGQNADGRLSSGNNVYAYVSEIPSVSGYLPLSGGTMTGTIYRAYTSNDQTPLIWINGANCDNYIWQVSDSTTTKQHYGFGLKYLGTGSGNNNKLVLYADNCNGTDVAAYSITQDGVITFGATPNVNGTNVSLAGHTHSYLPLTGGTLSGDLIVSKTGGTSTLGGGALTLAKGANSNTIKLSSGRFADNTGTFAYTSEIPSVSGYATETWVGNNYLPLTGGTLTGTGNVLTLSNTSGGTVGLLFKRASNTAWEIDNNTGNLYFIDVSGNSSILLLKEVSQGGEGYIRGNLIYHAGNLTKVSQLTNDSGFVTSSGSVNYATSAGSVAWDNVSSKPTTLSGYGITDGLYSTQVTSSQNNITWAQGIANSTRRGFYYNTSGTEWSYLFGLSSSNFNGDKAKYGAILKMGYTDRYLRLLRVNEGTWQSTDWEKIYAGYADSAGSVAWTNVSERPTNVSSFTNDAGYVTASSLSNYLPKSGGTLKGTGDTPLTIQTGATSGVAAYIKYADVNGGTLGWIGINSGVPKFVTSANVSNTMYHSGNLTNVSQLTNDAGYVTSSGSCSYTNYLKCYYSNAFHTENRIYAYWDSSNNRYQLKEETNNYTVYVSKSGYADSAGNADTVDGYHSSAFVRHRQNGYCYTDVASGYSASTTIKYWRVALPDNSSSWAMIQMEFNLIEQYSAGRSGKIIVYGNWSSTQEWNQFNAFIYGNLSTNIKVYGSDKKYIYIYTGLSWETLVLSKMICSDNITSYDISAIAIDYVDSLPTTYQTATLIRSINSDNIGSQSVNYATSAGSCTGNAETASKLATARTIWGQSFDGSANISGAMSGVESINGRVSFPTGTSWNPVLNIQGVYNANIDYLSIWVTATHRPLVLQLDAGNVGIGVAQPAYKLDVAGTLNATGAITQNGTAVSLNGHTHSNYITTNTDQTSLGGIKKWIQNAAGQQIGTGNVATQIDFLGVTFYAKALGTSGTKYSKLYTDVNGKMYVKYDTDGGSSPTTKTIAYTDDIPNVGSYVLRGELDAYMPLAGGTMQGSGSTPLIIKNGVASGVDAFIAFKDNSGNTLGNLGFSSGIPTYNNGTNNYALIHSNNWSSYIGTQTSPVAYASFASGAGSAGSATYATGATNDSDGNAINTTYLKKSGGTMSGDLTVGTSAGSVSTDYANSKIQFRKGSDNSRTDGYIKAVYDIRNAVYGMEYGASAIGIGITIYHNFMQNVYINGSCNATSHPTHSDARLKDIYDYNALVSVDTIASAPAIRFTWKDGVDKDLHCGTLAQYWDAVMPECTTQDNQGYLSMQYDVIALLAAISIAKKVMNHEERITELEKENQRLRTELEQLKAA